MFTKRLRSRHEADLVGNRRDRGNLALFGEGGAAEVLAESPELRAVRSSGATSRPYCILPPAARPSSPVSNIEPGVSLRRRLGVEALTSAVPELRSTAAPRRCFAGRLERGVTRQIAGGISLLSLVRVGCRGHPAPPGELRCAVTFEGTRVSDVDRRDDVDRIRGDT
jgi:hypothetical protein